MKENGAFKAIRCRWDTIVRMRNALRKNFRRRPKQIKHKMVLQLGINSIRNGTTKKTGKNYINREKIRLNETHTILKRARILIIPINDVYVSYLWCVHGT